jgi:hypothetical protein
MVNIANETRRAWADSAPLTATCILMLAAFIASCIGILVDDRLITGVPAWLKPAKFGISTAIFAGTVAWLYRYIAVWPRFMRAIGWLLAAVLVIEVAIIDLQAARGTTSHFNNATPLDATLFRIMGTAIGLLWLGSAAVLVALFRQKFENPEWGWWLRLGMLITVIGAAAGGLMLGLTSEQTEARRAGQPPSLIGGHTVGAPDGGPGLAGVGWSSEHGDLRIPHFFGLHGAQILPFLGWLIMRGRRPIGFGRRGGLAFAVGASYIAFIGILTWQALEGQSILNPDGTIMLALGSWAVATAGAILALRGAPMPAHLLTTSR